MNKPEAESTLKKVMAMLSSIGTPKEEVAEEVVVETELSEVEAEKVEETVEAVAEESVEAVSEPVETELSEEPKYVTAEELDSFKTELSATIKEALEALTKEKEELADQVVELSAQPSAEPIAHSPETEEKESFNFKVAKNRPKGYMDTVLGKLNQFN